MGISHLMVHWFEALHHRGAFAGLRSVLELGPQDLVLDLPVLVNFATSVTGVEQSPAAIEARFYEGGAKPRFWTAARDFYALLGLTDYYSADLEDKRADYSVDLNEPTRLDRQFDVITNFGTAEHVFNIANAMKVVHDHLKPGGLALHVLPTRGDYNHGFFNIHSTFYRSLALANHYEMVNLVNVPDFGGQHLLVGAHEKLGDGRPRKSHLVDISGHDDAARDEEFATSVIGRSRNAPNVFDYVFAALRKVSDAEFVVPQQCEEMAAGSVPPPPREPVETRFVSQLGLAVGLLQGHRFAEAEMHARAALEVKPDHPDALHALGLVFAHTGRAGEAIETLKRVCEVDPANVEGIKNLGFVLRALGRMGDAILCFRHLAAARPAAPQAHFDLATALHEAGDLAGAAGAYRQVVALEPGHVAAREALASMEREPAG
jgi:tetratricopeptide (TPR) repeat protein